MDRGGVRRPPYSAAERLLAIGETFGHLIDGELAANGGGDLEDLPFHRYLNLIHWWWRSKLTKEDDIKAFERSLEERQVVARSEPSWWHGDEEAAAASMAMAQALGLRTPTMGT